MNRMRWLMAGLLCGLGGANGVHAADRPPATVGEAREVSAAQSEEETDAPRQLVDAGHASPQGLGQLVIQDAQSGSTVRLNIARYHLHVVLQPPVALVQIDQSFYNPFPRQQEGTFVFNLPRGASVSRFAMYVTPSELIEGELIERQRAARIYQSIVDRQRDPAILEQIGDNLFKMRVFPIFAKDEKRILLDFTLPLESFDSVYDFRLPLLSDLAPIWDFRITGTVRGTGVSCLSHPAMQIGAREDGTVTLDFGQQNYRPGTDLVLSFEGAPPAATVVAGSGESERAGDAPRQPPSAMTPSLRSYRTEARRLGAWRGPAELWEPAATYFMVRIPPPTERPTPLPADVLLLADTSAGIENLDRVRSEIRRILTHLGSRDRFRLFAADVALRPMHDGWLSPGNEQVATALEHFEQQFCLGGTDMGACLHEAAEAFDQDADHRRIVIYVGDGADPLFGGSTGRANEQHFWQQWRRQTGADFAGVLVQPPPDGAVALSVSARATQGLWFDLPGDVAGQRQLLQWLRDGLPSPQPVLQVEVAGADGADLFWPGAWPPGRTLTIYGRTLQPGPIQLALTLGRGAETATHTWTLSAGDDADDVFVGRLWAQRRLDQLRRIGTEEETQRAEMIALSQEWSLLSPLTAFLVLESEADYKRWQIDRQVRRRYWQPAEARSDEPLPAQWLAEVAPPDPPSAPGQRSPRSGEPSPEAPATQIGKLPFDPLAADRWELRPSFAALVGSALRGSPAFLQRHPHAQTLLQPANLMQLGDGCTLDEFAQRLSEITGLRVMLDKPALDDSGIEEQTRIGGPRPRPRTAPSDPWPIDTRLLQAATISLRSGIRHLLEPLELVMIEEPHRLLITTVDAAVQRLSTEVYPVDDLVYTDRLPALWKLSDPYLDRDERSRRRLDAKLQQPVTADLVNIPLQQAVDRLASFLGETVVLDHRALLDDEGITPDQRITTTWRDIPAREALRWMLDPLRLDWEVRDEAIVITTPGSMRAEVRLYSGQDLVFEYPTVDGTRVDDRRWRMQGMGSGLGGASRWSAGGASRGVRGTGIAFSGGMGGMGGFSGGMQGALGGAAGASTPPAGVALSSGGDGGAIQQADQQPEPLLEAPFGEAPELPDSAASLPGDSQETRYEIDADPIIDLMTTTVAPESWDVVGGPGFVDFFPNSLDFVVSQTRPVHEHLESLVERLRAMPTIAGAASGGRPATVPWISSQIHGSADYDLLIDVITASVAPMEWDVVGGPGAIDAEPLRAVLVVDQSPQVHHQVQRLLTLLRRSRYESACGSRPWETPVGGSTHGPVAAPLAGSDAGPLLQVADLPPLRPEQLNTLQVRREDDVAEVTWRRIPSEGPASGGTIRRTGSWIECQLEHCTLRLEGDETTVHWPSLRLVELGRFCEALRRGLDAQLPWMPHRTNEELARWFDVRRVPGETPEARDDCVWVRLVPIGLPRDGDSYLLIAYSNDSGQPIAWESHEAGKRVARIEFDERPGGQAQAGGRTAVWRDADGKERIRWELTAPDSAPGKTTPAKDRPDALALMSGWGDFLVLDYRTERPLLDVPLADALTAIRQFDWTGAVDQLRLLSVDRGPHPLASLLEAWCLENAPQAFARDRQAALLSEVARSGAGGLMDFITEQHFPSLSRETRYAILLLQPETNRTAADDDRLARAAISLGRRAEALEHLRSASERDQSPEAAEVKQREAARQRLRLQLHLELSQFDEARAVVDQWVAEHAADATALADVAELLARHAQPQRAEDVARAALAIETLDDAARYTLLLRLAQWRQGAERCRTLLEAAQLKPAESRRRAECLQRLLAQLIDPAHAELAGWLATQTAQADLRSALWIRQAELTRDTRLAAELFWQVQQAGRLDDGRLATALRIWNRAGHAARVIETCEQRLRAGCRLPDGAAEHLAAAYLAENRPKDARRAASHPPQPAPTAPDRETNAGGFF